MNGVVQCGDNAYNNMKLYQGLVFKYEESMRLYPFLDCGWYDSNVIYAFQPVKYMCDYFLSCAWL